MPRTSPSAVAARRDVLVGTTVEGTREDASSAIGYGLANAAGGHSTLQSAPRFLVH
jgi:hypothetical protein